jgi:hypothetical protein
MGHSILANSAFATIWQLARIPIAAAHAGEMRKSSSGALVFVGPSSGRARPCVRVLTLL